MKQKRSAAERDCNVAGSVFGKRTSKERGWRDAGEMGLRSLERDGKANSVARVK